MNVIACEEDNVSELEILSVREHGIHRALNIHVQGLPIVLRKLGSGGAAGRSRRLLYHGDDGPGRPVSLPPNPAGMMKSMVWLGNSPEL